MSMTPLAYADSLRIGSIDFISPIEIKVMLDAEAPDGTALNTGSPRPFPQINGYVLVPNNAGFLVGQIEWITIERSQLPSQLPFKKDSLDLIDLPYPLRKMSVMPLGTLFYKGVEGSGGFVFKRGISNFPSVGAPVLLPTKQQLKDIVESGEHRRVKIGTSPLADGAEVMVDPDRLFGRHLAVLGNTGSGKSCSVAGLIHWSLEAAKEKLGKDKSPNARFIVLDPNGEYSKAFSGQDNVRVFSVEPNDGIKQLQVPLWFWNAEEWSSFTNARSGTQRPVLRRALREVRAGRYTAATSEETKKLKLRRKLSSLLVQVRSAINSGLEKTEETRFGYRLIAYHEDLELLREDHSSHRSYFDKLITAINCAIDLSQKEYPPGNIYFRAFPESSLQNICDELSRFIKELGGIVYSKGPNEDDPLPFTSAELPDHIELLAQQEGVSQHVDYLVMRIRTMLADTRITKVFDGSTPITLDSWLRNYVGSSEKSDGTITVIDLSLVPAEVVHIVTAVVSRMTLEALQRYRKLNNGKVLPTVLVMEEAHTFVKRYKEDSENQSTAAICCKVFEKIAREGRKFGLGMVLSSQRPSELSPTVLSQCNSFLLHRISNDRDQELVHRLVPDNLRGLLRDLPSLPARHAILLGWASELPTLVEMNHLSDDKRPQSDDPDFWAVWSGEGLETDGDGRLIERSVDWRKIADDWQQAGDGND